MVCHVSLCKKVLFLVQLGGLAGNGNPCRGAFAQLGHHLYVATHLLYHRVGDGQLQTGAADGVVLAGGEALEDMLQRLFADADAGIFDDDGQHFVAVFVFGPHRALRRAEGGIGADNLYHLAQVAVVELAHQMVVRILDDVLHFGLGQIAPAQLAPALEHECEVGGLFDKLDHVGIET